MRSFVVLVSAFFGCLNIISGQQCGVPKAFDTMALGQQFRKPRALETFADTFKRPIFVPNGDARLRKQTVHHPWINDKDKTANRIVGGYDIIEKTGGQLCWQVGIIIGLFRGYFNCGGTIVGSKTIVTAAHCVVSWRGGVRGPNEFTVVAGASDGACNGSNSAHCSSGCGRSFSVKSVIMNPQYDPSTSNNDNALLLLNDAMDFSKSCMCPLCLADTQPAVGEFCITSGFGNENEDGNNPDDPIPLRWVYLQVLQNEPGTCSVNGNTNLSLFICAGNVVGQDSCQGDSGGPLACWNQATSSYYLAGIVSFGVGCARGIGGQYTKVLPYNNFIRSNSGGNVV